MVGVTGWWEGEPRRRAAGRPSSRAPVPICPPFSSLSQPRLLPPILLVILLLHSTAATRLLRANERFADTLTTVATAVGPFFPPAGNAIGIFASAVPALRSAGVKLPGCTACPVDAATPLRVKTRTINNLLIAANDAAIVTQPGGTAGTAARFFRTTGTK